jgi:colanic acid biosynthesis protein WcaH
MDVHDAHIPEDLFGEFTARMPQVCVEVVLETAEGVLVAKRENDPQVWFWPGGRLYKGERLDAAARRIADEELGIAVDLRERLGVYEHFWEEEDLDGSSTRHTVNVVFLARPETDGYEIELDEQHSAYRFLTEVEPGLHEYVRRYLRENDLV